MEPKEKKSSKSVNHINHCSNNYIIKAHGGQLNVETVANEGAVFTFVLPAGTIE
jgi:light-regulated signal transduction histidine kinase (bacteriophytochrome)